MPLCHHCKEYMEVGDAYVPIQVGTRTYYYHPFCSTFANPVRELEEAQNEDAEFEPIASQARSVC